MAGGWALSAATGGPDGSLSAITGPWWWQQRWQSCSAYRVRPVLPEIRSKEGRKGGCLARPAQSLEPLDGVLSAVEGGGGTQSPQPATWPQKWQRPGLPCSPCFVVAGGHAGSGLQMVSWSPLVSSSGLQWSPVVSWWCP